MNFNNLIPSTPALIGAGVVSIGAGILANTIAAKHFNEICVEVVNPTPDVTIEPEPKKLGTAEVDLDRLRELLANGTEYESALELSIIAGDKQETKPTKFAEIKEESRKIPNFKKNK